jgi:raffinose/stachyose/melibiose transport system permease protein
MISGKPAKVPFAAQKHPRKRLTWVEPLFWVLPALVIYVVFKLGPLLASFYFSLIRWNGIDPPIFVWFQNFQRLLVDKQVILALWHNVHFAVGTVIGKIVLSLILALLLNNALRGRVFYRTSLFLPVVMSFVVVGILWTWMYDYRVGMINALFRLIGLNSLTQDWLGDTKIAMWSLILVDIWKWYGFHMVIFLAGLQTIPQELYESAMIDGASSWNQFWAITLPMLRPVMLVNVTLSLMGAFNVFDIPFIMTEGGPANSTQVMATLVYIRGFKFYNFGYASALSVVLFIVVIAVASIQMKLMAKED